jgi:hypothetical protein
MLSLLKLWIRIASFLKYPSGVCVFDHSAYSNFVVDQDRFFIKKIPKSNLNSSIEEEQTSLWPKEKVQIRVITKLPNSEQSSKGKVKTHKYINRQNQSIIGKL